MTEFYQDIISAIPLGIAVYDDSGQCVAANDAVAGIIGATREQVLAQNYRHIETWKRHGLLDAALRAVRNGSSVQHECTVTTSFGRGVTLSCRLEPFTSGKSRFLLLIVRDISEQKTAEDSLRISEKKIELALDGADLAFWIWNVSEGATFFSPRYFSMLGYEVDELPHSFETWDGLLHPEDRERAKSEVLQAVDARKNWSIEFRLRTKNGDYCWILGRGRVLEYDPEGRPLVAAGTHLDISERKKTEAAVIEEKNKLEAVMAALSDGITVQDREFRILYQNEAHRKMQGIHMGELCYRAYQNRNDVCPRCLVARSFADGQVHRRETLAKGREGETIHLEVSSSPVKNAQGEITAVIEAVRDITEQKKLESEVLKAQKLESLGVLAGGIAHDFNNYLTAVLSNMHLAKMYLDTGHKAHDRLIMAEKAILKTVALTQQLLTFSKGGAPVKKSLDLAALLAESARFALSGSRARCDINVEDGLWHVEADEGQISQVVHNLVVNADQSMPAGGTISIRAENVILDSGVNVPLQQGRYVKVIVADEGVGISGEHMLKIFDPYFTTKQKGSGLGLSVTYSIVKRHDGHIVVESRKGAGTAFTVYLPASEGPGAGENPSGPLALKGEGRILVVDDDEMVRNSMTGLLSAMGFDVEHADEGGEAVKKYRRAMASSQPYDVVILDLTIPGGMGGKDTVKELLLIDPHVRAVVASGYSDDPVIANYRDYGFVDTLAKPYTDKELFQVLSRVLKGPGAGGRAQGI